MLIIISEAGASYTQRHHKRIIKINIEKNENKYKNE